MSYKTRRRDFQREACYSAERKTYPWYNNPPVFKDLVEVRNYIKIVMASKYWKQQKGPRKIPKIKQGLRNARWDGRRFTMVIAPKAFLPWVVIHEMSHCLTEHQRGNDVPPHGSTFCAHHLALITELLGPEMGQELRKNFDALGVKYQATVL